MLDQDVPSLGRSRKKGYKKSRAVHRILKQINAILYDKKL
jgi:hypothetical protein